MKYTVNGKNFIIEGIKQVADIVCSTYGPNGRKVYISADEKNGVVRDRATRDGVTVARYCQDVFGPEDGPGWEYKNIGSRILVDAANRTVRSAGDGTTLTCLLTRKVLEEFEGVSNEDIRRLKDLSEDIVSRITAKAVAPTEETLREMAIIAANNNEYLGTMIADMIWKLGRYSFVSSEIAKDGITRCEIKKGYTLASSVLSKVFMMNRNRVVYNRSMVLLVEQKIDKWEDLIPVLSAFKKKSFYANKSTGEMQYKYPLFLVVADIEDKPFQVLVNNFTRKNREIRGENDVPVPIFPIKAPSGGRERYDFLEDLRYVVNTRCVFSHLYGVSLANFKEDDFGWVDSVDFTEHSCTFFNEEFDQSERIAYLKEAMESDPDNPILEQRLAKLSSGIGIVHLGGYTDNEIMYMDDVVEDCVKACQSAMAKGIVPGGGACLGEIGGEYLDEFSEDSELYSSLIRVLWHPSEFLTGEVRTQAFNVITGEKDEKIRDSALAVMSAVTNAISLSCEVLQSKYAIGPK